MTEMQENHQKVRDEYERILKQLKQENELLNQQIKQHLTEQSLTNNQKMYFIFLFQIFNSIILFVCFVVVRLILNPPTKISNDSTPSPQPEIFLYKYLNAWRDAFAELTIYVEERLKNHNRSSENNEKVFSSLFY